MDHSSSVGEGIRHYWIIAPLLEKALMDHSSSVGEGSSSVGEGINGP